MVGGLREDLVAFERRRDDVVPKRARQPQRVGRGLEIGRIHGLDPGGVFEDDPELVPISLLVGLGQCQPGETRHMADVDVDGHGGSVGGDADVPYPSQPGDAASVGVDDTLSSRMDRTLRLMIGVAALVLGVGGAAWVLAADDTLSGEVAIRVSLVLAAVWLAAPMLRRPGPATVAAGAVAVLALIRPRLVVVVIVGVVIWRLSTRRRDLRDRRP